MYIRFVTTERNEGSDQATGLFAALYALERDGALAPHELEWFRTTEAWFNKHLPRPDRFRWSARPNAPRRAISWFRLSAGEHVNRMRELAALLEYKDIPVEELQTDRPGYILYEDEHQVTAVPFAAETFG